MLKETQNVRTTRSSKQCKVDLSCHSILRNWLCSKFFPICCSPVSLLLGTSATPVSTRVTRQGKRKAGDSAGDEEVSVKRRKKYSTGADDYSFEQGFEKTAADFIKGEIGSLWRHLE